MSAGIYTIGHSVRPLDELVGLLRAHGITGLADVRTVPRSRRHPHFSRTALEQSLPQAGIAYRHVAGLGGLRKPRPDSSNQGWRQEAFRGYADHMQTLEFLSGVDDLLAFAAGHTVAVMCAEAKWWECHRRLLADALVARGVAVRHIMARHAAPPHELTAFARVDRGQVTYPALI